jgi:putative CocE/NonD family hydrolase
LTALALSILFVACAAGQSIESHFVTADDGVRLAVDVHLPSDAAPGQKFPTMLELTRYWRSAVDPETGKAIRGSGLNRIDREFQAAGYAIVKVDVRGTGASFGHRLEEYGPREVRDGYAIVDWVSKQSWSDGNVGAYGISYSGTTADLISSCKHPALKAVIPGWSDFDLYASPGRPYGMCPEKLMGEWGQMVGWMDENNVEKMGGSVRPVEPSLLSAAIQDHEKNVDVAEMERQADFRDVSYLGGRPMCECAALHWKKDIEEGNVPMLVLASWLDAGTADGALLRFQHFRNPQYLVILASSHGGMTHASPYVVSESIVPPVPTGAEQIALWIAFADHFMKNAKHDVPNWPKIRYFNMGEEKMLESEVWPPKGSKPHTVYFAAQNSLTVEAPTEDNAADRYEVDFEVNTGPANRWNTQMGRPVLALDHRELMDERMLCYTSEPLNKPLQITGVPEVHLWLRASQADGAVIVYLEDVAPDGQSRYISEGGLRFMHRKITPNPDLPQEILPHSYAVADRQDLVPGEITSIAFRMWPTSVKIAQGHRLRIAIAGADVSTFSRLPAEGPIELNVHRDRANPSHVVLPVIAAD